MKKDVIETLIVVGGVVFIFGCMFLPLLIEFVSEIN